MTLQLAFLINFIVCKRPMPYTCLFLHLGLNLQGPGAKSGSMVVCSFALGTPNGSLGNAGRALLASAIGGAGGGGAAAPPAEEEHPPLQVG